MQAGALARKQAKKAAMSRASGTTSQQAPEKETMNLKSYLEPEDGETGPSLSNLLSKFRKSGGAK